MHDLNSDRFHIHSVVGPCHMFSLQITQTTIGSIASIICAYIPEALRMKPTHFDDIFAFKCNTFITTGLIAMTF